MAAVVWRMALCLLAVWFLAGLDPSVNQWKWGYFDSLAVVVLLAGAYHLAGHYRLCVLFVCYGSLGAALMVSINQPMGRDYLSFARYPGALVRWDVGWCAFTVAMGMLCGLMAWVRYWQLDRRRKRPSPKCPNCGYLLYGLPENRCPECGQTFDPTMLGGLTPPSNADVAGTRGQIPRPSRRGGTPSE